MVYNWTVSGMRALEFPGKSTLIHGTALARDFLQITGCVSKGVYAS
jgi:hypothetical protein